MPIQTRSELPVTTASRFAISAETSDMPQISFGMVEGVTCNADSQLFFIFAMLAQKNHHRT